MLPSGVMGGLDLSGCFDGHAPFYQVKSTGNMVGC